MDIESDLPQDYEQIPWSHLVPPQKDRSLQLAAIAIAIIAVFLAIVFFMRRAPAAAPIVASTTAAPSVVEAPPPEVPPEAPAAVSAAPTTTLPAGPRIYSEADLMAVLPPPDSDSRLLAIARAEWFVTDYFTVDGDASLADGVNAMLPDVVDLPVTDGSAISYVEWARAVEVLDHRDGVFDVTVWFRTLVGDADGGFSRTGVRAVDVRLVTDELGRLAIADVPIVAGVAPAGVAPGWLTGPSPPQAIVDQGVVALGGFGAGAELESAGEADGAWRLVFSIGDASGLRFPVAVHIKP